MKPPDRFEVVREDVGLRIHHDVERAQVAAVVAAENLDLRAPGTRS